jgi:uroporphyrinogen-III synthase
MNVILTHSNNRFEILQSVLEQRGFSVVHHPLVRTRAIPNVNLEPIMDCDWWLFTSVAAVEVLNTRGVLVGRKVAAVGVATAQALRHAGANVAFMAIGGNSDSFAKEFLEYKPKDPIAILGGDHSLMTLPNALRAANLEVRFLEVYQTRSNSWDDFVGHDQHYAIVLMSPSAVNVIPEDVARASDLVALGQTTAASILARGWTCVVAQKPEMVAVIEVLEALKDGRINARFN